MYCHDALKTVTVCNSSKGHWSDSYGKKIVLWRGCFCFLKAEFKLRRRVPHLRSDVEKVVLIKHRLLWIKDRGTDRPTVRRTQAAKISWFVSPVDCREGERELRSDLYGVWTGIPSSTCESRVPSPNWIQLAHTFGPVTLQTCRQWPVILKTRTETVMLYVGKK